MKERKKRDLQHRKSITIKPRYDDNMRGSRIVKETSKKSRTIRGVTLPREENIEGIRGRGNSQ